MAVALHNGDAEPTNVIWVEAEPPETAVGSDGDVAVYKKGAWSKEEDEKLRKAVDEFGIKNWVNIEKFSGLGRPAKNCRLRWLNYLRPNLKKYPFTEEEEKLIFELHSKYGNSWARIAAKLPGRSDNEIKNFWHKRAKKCKRDNLPIYSPEHNKQKQIQTNHSNQYHTTLEANINSFRTNHPNHTLPQFQPLTPKITSLSPQTMISSTPQTQSLSSPTTLLTSTYQTTLPTLPQNSLSSSPLNQTPSLCQGGSVASPSARPLSILSAPLCQLLRVMGQLSPSSNGHSTLDSSSQMPCSSTVESPRSPLNLKLSPGIPAQYSMQMSTPMGFLSGFQSNLTSTTPLSPLKLRLSLPGSNLSNSDPIIQMNSSTSSVLLSSQPATAGTEHTVPMNSSLTGTEQPSSIQFSSAGVNSSMHEVESVNNLEILEELRKAQAKVKFLKKKLKQNLKNEQSFSDESPEPTNSLRSEVPLDGKSNQSMRNDCAPKSTRKKYTLKRIPKRKGEELHVKNLKKDKRENLEIYSDEARKGGDSESKISSEQSLHREDSEGYMSKNSASFLEQKQSIDLLNHLNNQNNAKDQNSDMWDNRPCSLQGLAKRCPDECSAMEGLFGETSTLLQDSLFRGDLSGQTCPTQRYKPLFDPIYTREQVDDEGDLLNYIQNNDCEFPEYGFMDGYMAAKSVLCESEQLTQANNMLELQPCEASYTQYQPTAVDLLSSCYQAGEVQDSLGGVQAPETNLFEQCCLQTWIPEPFFEIEGSFADDLWPLSQMVSQDQIYPINQFDSVVNSIQSQQVEQ